MTSPATSAPQGPTPALHRALALAAHLLPAQNPLSKFVHHNPLHAFEGEPFEDAVERAAAILGNQPYLPEAEYQELFRAGRISPADLEHVVARRVPDSPVPGVRSRRTLTTRLMLSPPELAGGARLRWALSETDALTALKPTLAPEVRASLLGEAGGDERHLLHRLWARCESLRPRLDDARTPSASSAPVRVRDILAARLGDDPDRIVDGLFIRWAGAYLDQGVAYWPMSDRPEGFYQAFLAHVDLPLALGRPWEVDVRRLVHHLKRENLGAEGAAEYLLGLLGHPPEQWDDVVLRTLLTLRGWAGMFQRLADRPDVSPWVRLPTRLVDALAVRLILDVAAARFVLGDRAPPRLTLWERASTLPIRAEERPSVDRAWTLFQVCVAAGIGPDNLQGIGVEGARDLLSEVDALNGVVRRRLWHAAYELHHRDAYLSALSSHVRRGGVAAPERRVQAIFCIDDREESLRRHLEEVDPRIQTFGVAGNFGISLYFHGLEHGRPVALGPAVREPCHLVVERPAHGTAAPARWVGRVDDHVQVGSGTLLRGAAIALAGWASVVPMTWQILDPVGYRLWSTRRLPPTALEYKRSGDRRDEEGRYLGFSLEERVAAVRATLRSIGLIKDFAPVVLCVGHGATTSNNPHFSAYECGACGGGRGGPNARLFALWANEPEVRDALANQGIVIPPTTRFLGCWHDTCDDAVAWYDLDDLSAEHQRELEHLMSTFGEARARNAHERGRRFEALPLEATPHQALRHVQKRAADLSQPRPEYCHATNGVALIGRRTWSRGLFLDRRSFLVSYDPGVDPDGTVLAALLGQVVPVGSGINLEYWFSRIDNRGYGAGTKLPHNVTGLFGVMDGHASDLRTGLWWQTVEIHEPVRLLTVVEATPERLLKIAAEVPDVGRVVANGWVTLASFDPETGNIQVFEDGQFRPWRSSTGRLASARSSLDWYRGHRGALPPASILGEEA